MSNDKKSIIISTLFKVFPSFMFTALTVSFVVQRESFTHKIYLVLALSLSFVFSFFLQVYFTPISEIIIFNVMTDKEHQLSIKKVYRTIRNIGFVVFLKLKLVILRGRALSAIFVVSIPFLIAVFIAMIFSLTELPRYAFFVIVFGFISLLFGCIYEIKCERNKYAYVYYFLFEIDEANTNEKYNKKIRLDMLSESVRRSNYFFEANVRKICKLEWSFIGWEFCYVFIFTLFYVLPYKTITFYLFLQNESERSNIKDTIIFNTEFVKKALQTLQK